MKIWSCKIGEVDPNGLSDGADSPMRQAVQVAYRMLTGQEPEFCFSGWAAELDEVERKVAESHVEHTTGLRDLMHGSPPEKPQTPLEPQPATG